MAKLKRHRELIAAAKNLREQMAGLRFENPVAHVYNPLEYAWESHKDYLLMANSKGVRTLFLGMNPGPWGMAQTGVPFGEIHAVKNWMGITRKVRKPQSEHPKRPIEGFDCTRSEVSGRRFWGLFQTRFKKSEHFFREHFVANFCPLVFMEDTGRNRTPDKLTKSERAEVDRYCGQHLQRIIQILEPSFLVGVGAYAEKQFHQAAGELNLQVTITRILHPSPASPAANRDWVGTVEKQLHESGIWV